jgi:hypothetical protein
MRRPALLITLTLCLVTAAIGAWAGAEYGLARTRSAPSLHETLHHQLHLSADQQARIAGLERDYEGRRRALEAEMVAANADLAAAYQDQHAYGPRMQAAIDRFHHAMAALQKETLLHVTAMRAVLTPSQARAFDATVVKSLTTPTS